jgi:2-oxoglutarate dehydrogenase E1 component
MTVAMPSTPASHFHLLRWQARREPRRPLIVFTPKSMLRLRAAASGVEDFTTGGWRPVLPDAAGSDIDPASVTRVLLCSGKVYYDLNAERISHDDSRTVIVRVEQLAPLAGAEIAAEVAKYPNADVVWVQEEPANQGGWPFMALGLPEHLDGRTLLRASRPGSASPATGSPKVHQAEQRALVEQAFAR